MSEDTPSQKPRQPITSAQTVLAGLVSAADNLQSKEDLHIRCEPLFREYFTKMVLQADQ
jgi:hypothetical protein